MDEHQLSNKIGKDLRLKYYCRKTELGYINQIKRFMLLENKFTLVKDNYLTGKEYYDKYFRSIYGIGYQELFRFKN